jgi:hypothetical protein
MTLVFVYSNGVVSKYSSRHKLSSISILCSAFIDKNALKLGISQGPFGLSYWGGFGIIAF